KQPAVELEARGGVDRVHPIELVDRLAEDEPPTTVALLEEVVEAAAARDVDLDALDLRTLVDLHLHLGDRAIPDDVGDLPTEDVVDPDALLPSRLAHRDELVGRALRPGRHHAAVVVPDRAEPLPVARVTEDHPALDQLADLEPVAQAFVEGRRHTRAVRQLSGRYVLRTVSTYGTGLTTARISTWTCGSTVGLRVPPSSSPQTKVTSVPGSACRSSRTASVSILPSFAL